MHVRPAARDLWVTAWLLDEEVQGMVALMDKQEVVIPGWLAWQVWGLHLWQLHFNQIGSSHARRQLFHAKGIIA